MNDRLWIAIAVAALSAAVVCAQTPATLNLEMNRPKAAVSPMLYGLMTEEINYSYDGGLYPELIRNRTFRSDWSGILNWYLIEKGSASAKLTVDDRDGPSAALRNSAKLEVTRADANSPAGLLNEGYWGMAVRSNSRYTGSFYAKSSSDSPLPVRIALVADQSGEVLGNASVDVTGAAWKQYKFDLRSGKAAASAENHFELTVARPATLWLQLVSLLPPTYHDRPNGNRIDIMDDSGAHPNRPGEFHAEDQRRAATLRAAAVLDSSPRSDPEVGGTMLKTRLAGRLILAFCGAASMAQVKTEVPTIVPVAKPVAVERIKVHTASLEGNLEGNSADREVFVFLPPGYATGIARRYPVVYALHGYSIGAEQWTKEIHVPQTIEGAFAQGAQEMIVVLPDSKTVHNGSMYSSSATTGDFEQFISRDLVAYIDAHYRTIPARASRGLVGHSMGGYGASRIGMKHSDTFGALYHHEPVLPLGPARRTSQPGE